jgi:predicted aspartyl protease
MANSWSVILLWTALCTVSQADVALPLEIHNAHGLIVRGELAGEKNLKFLIDTGSAPSVLNRKLAQKLRLEMHGSSAFVLAATVDLQVTTLPQVALGPIELRNHFVMVTDLKEVEKRFGTRIDLIVGLDILAQRPFTIDYVSKTLTFGDIVLTRASVPYDWISNGRAHYILLRAEIDGRLTRLLLDTGARDIILFSAHVPELAKIARFDAELAAGSLAHQKRVFILPRAGLRLAGLKVDKRDIYFVEGGQALNFDGILGPTAIGLTRMSLDQQRKLLVLQSR